MSLSRLKIDYSDGEYANGMKCSEVLWNEGLEVLVPAVGAALIAILVAGLPTPPPQ